MKNYKAFYLISAFTEDELNLFEDFLKSPYFNTRTKPIELFRIIKKNRTKPESYISKEKIFDKLYPGKKFNANTFNDLMAQLHRLAEEFLYTEINKKDKTKKDLTILDKFLEARFKGLFMHKKKQLDKRLDEIEKIDSFFFWYSYLKEMYHINYIMTYENIKTKKDFSKIENIIYDSAASLLNLSLEDIMSIYVIAETRKTHLQDECLKFISSVTFKLFEPEFLELIKPRNKFHHNLTLMNDLLNMFLYPADSKFYLSYKESLKKCRAKLATDQVTFHYAYLLGYCIKKINENKNDSVFLQELNRLFKEILREERYKSVKVNNFRPLLYSSLLNVFFTTENTKAIKELIEICSPLLEKKYSDFYEKLSYSYLHYINKDYSKALSILSNVQSNFKSAEYKFKTYIIKLNFLLNNTEQVLNLLESYIKYTKAVVANKELLFKKRLNFAKFMKEMTLYNDKGAIQKLSYLYKKVSDEQMTDEKDWLLATLENILEKKK